MLNLKEKLIAVVFALVLFAIVIAIIKKLLGLSYLVTILMYAACMVVTGIMAFGIIPIIRNLMKK